MEHHLNQQNLQSKIAFVLGNGKSRLKLQLASLKSVATIYACNAIYREFEPDFLIAVDTKMINEIIKAGYHNDHQVWTNPNRSVKNINNLNLFNPHKGWSSGPTALWFASQNNHKDIYIFGFDYQGLDGKFNNVYADTFNYKKSTDAATYHGNWLNQTHTIIKENKKINYYRVINSNDYIPDKLINLNNLTHITYEEFGKKYSNCI